MAKDPKVPRFQQARGFLVSKKKIREIKVSKLKWNLQRILDKDKERWPWVDAFFCKEKIILISYFSCEFENQIKMNNDKFLNASGRRGFRNQSGSDSYYVAGEAMALSVFQEGGVNALLDFLAGFNMATFTAQ